MSEIDDLKKEVEKLSNSRQLWIATATAVIGAIASVIAAYYGYTAQLATITGNRDNTKTTTAYDAYKTFGTLIVTGDTEQRCRALLLITAMEPQTGVKLVNEELAKQIECNAQPNFTKAIKTSLGAQCTNGRPTRTTLNRLKNKDSFEKANVLCNKTLPIPDRFEGPWPDGTISFTSGQSIEDENVWCNCLPSGAEAKKVAP